MQESVKIAQPPLRSGAPRHRLESLYRQRLSEVKKQLAAQTDVEFGANPFRSLRRRFIVAHTPRVGSHLLCEGLLRHGAAVEEFFELPRIETASAKRGFSKLQQYCAWLLQKYAVGGVFGVSGGVKILAPLDLAGEAPRFISDWRFVHLKRVDLVKQAVSETIALQTGAYKSSKTPSRTLADDDFSSQKIKRLIDASLAINAAWEGAFYHYGVEPLRLTYEALSADPAGIVASTAAFLDLDGAPITDDRFLAPPLKKQATSLNQAWEDRFRAENPAFCEQREAGDFELS